MKGRAACVFGIALCCLSTSTAWAQDKGDTGLTMSVPTAIGVIWHASDRVAIRPDVSFGFSEDGTVSSDSTSSTWSVAGSLGAQYALATRFGLFAEAGLSYASQRSENSSLSVAERTTWTFGTRAAVGGILYF